MPYALTIRKQPIKTLLKMPRRNAKRIRHAMDKLADNPDRRDVDIASLKGRPGYRLRVGGFRIIFERDDDMRVIDVLRIAPRSHAYKQ